MRRRALLTGLAAMTAVGAAARAAEKTPLYSGVVTVGSATRFTELLADRMDKVVGLSVRIVANTEAEFARQRYLVSRDPKFLGVTKGDIEIVIDGVFRPKGRAYAVEGFFRVVSGGMHQGIQSYSLKRVSAPPPAQVIRVAL